MISFLALGVRFKLPLLTLIFPLLAAVLDISGAAWGILLSMGVHEMAHVLAARICGVNIQEITLMPFGGSARIENPYHLPGRRLIPVAAAGALANLALAVLFAAMAHWHFLDAKKASAVIQPSLVMMIFNLIPALPLDGGRIAYVFFARSLGETAAINLCIWFGRLLAAMLAVAALAGGFVNGRWNLSFILAAVFLISSGRAERTAMYAAHARRIADAARDESGAIPVRIYQADRNTRADAALKLVHPHEHVWFILTHSGAPCSLLNDQCLLRHLVQNGAPETTLGEMQGFCFPRPIPRHAD